ncbi:hypothetical protein [Thalassorhabdomicrobium marinisediminis]|uniref:hypothetical protein n=1 Tax=Thalassorhabdomicrobium marinisediminis TaxID=2170577 RepID=UPI0011B1DC6C|nr:hypothetical protein [Thalassorhabdomicrobium marinisediminis]
MARVVIGLLFVLVIVGLAVAAGRFLQSTREADVPATAKTISYVLLIILMLGVVSGWLGGL